MSEVLKGADQLEQLEELIRQVQGIISARIIAENEEIKEIHVLASNIRNPKQIVRDIETVALVRLGVTLDHRKVSIVQLQEDLECEGRIKLNSITFKRSGQQAELTVELALGEELFTGQAVGPSTAANQLRLAGKATAAALEKYLGIENLLVIEDISRLTLGGRQVVAAGVAIVSDRGEEAMFGIAAINGDIWEAAGKAVLAAVNRRLGKIGKS